MKKILFLFILSSINAYAVFPKINAKGVSGDYVEGEGQAYAEYVEYELPEVKLIHKDIDVSFNKPEKFLVISDKNSSVSIKFDFSFMNVFNICNFKDLKLSSDKNFFQLNLERLYIMLAPNDFTLTKVDISANVEESEEKEMSFLEGFLFKGKAEIEALHLGDYSFETLLEEIALKLPEKGIKALPVTGRFISLEATQGKIYGQVLLDSWVNLWLRFNGDIFISEDKKELVVDLHSARLGLFSIRATVLKKLAKIQNEKIKVEGNRIRILIGPSSKQ